MSDSERRTIAEFYHFAFTAFPKQKEFFVKNRELSAKMKNEIDRYPQKR